MKRDEAHKYVQTSTSAHIKTERESKTTQKREASSSVRDDCKQSSFTDAVICCAVSYRMPCYYDVYFSQGGQAGPSTPNFCR